MVSRRYRNFFLFFLVFSYISSFFKSCRLCRRSAMLLLSLAKFEVYFMELTAITFFPAIPEQVLCDLRKLNIPMHLSGYRCLCVAIPLFAQDISQSMCNELYPAVAKELGYMDWRAVEFAMRRTILSAWKHRDTHIWNECFPGIAKAPTNKRFIATLAQRIK